MASEDFKTKQAGPELRTFVQFKGQNFRAVHSQYIEMKAQLHTQCWGRTNLTDTKPCPTETGLREQTSLLSTRIFSLPIPSSHLLYSSVMYSKLEEINL